MACIELPDVSAPVLPPPLTITPPSLTTPGLDINLCCKMPPISIPSVPLAIPPIILNPAVIATLNAYIASAVDYINSLSLPCPLE